MVRTCVLDEGGTWLGHGLLLIEFVYNNNYHASIGMTPYEPLYGRKRSSPLCWCELGEKTLIGPDIVQETTNKISLIRERTHTAQSRQKRNANKWRKPLEFQEGKHVFLRVTPN